MTNKTKTIKEERELKTKHSETPEQIEKKRNKSPSWHRCDVCYKWVRIDNSCLVDISWRNMEVERLHLCAKHESQLANYLINWRNK